MRIDQVRKKIKEEGVFWHLLKRIRHQIENDRKGVVIIIIGAPGDGKSILSNTIAYLTDKKYKVRDREKLKKLFDERILYTASDFLKAITNEKNKKYSTFIFEDAGTMDGFSARRFMTTTNQAISSVLQTIRRNRFVIIFNVQTKKLVDVNIRDSNLAHFLIFATGVDTEEQLNNFKIYQLSYDPISDNIYRKFLKYKNPKTGVITKKRNYTAKLRLPDYYLETYEKFADEKKRMVEERCANKVSMKEADDQKNSETKSPKEIADELLEKIEVMALNGQMPKFLKYQKNYRKWCVNQGYIMYNYDVGTNRAIQIKGMIEMKIKEKNIDEKLDFIGGHKFINNEDIKD